MENVITDNPRTQFASAVAAAISSVHHLYREVDRLIGALRDSLAQESQPLQVERGTLQKSGREGSRVVVRNEFGLLFSAADEDEDLDEEDDDIVPDDDSEADSAPSRRRGRAIEISSDSAFLAVRIALHDPRARGGFEPILQYAVLRDWLAGDVKMAGDQRGHIAHYMLKRIPRALGTAAPTPGARMTTSAVFAKLQGKQRSKERRVSCTLPSGITAVPLFDLGDADALERLAEQMRATWREHSGAI